MRVTAFDEGATVSAASRGGSRVGRLWPGCGVYLPGPSLRTGTVRRILLVFLATLDCRFDLDLESLAANQLVEARLEVSTITYER